MNHQISIVGSQLLPIYVGIREFNPDVVHFIVSKESSGNLSLLTPLVGSAKYSQYKCNPFDFFEIKAICETIISQLKTGDNVTFNLTGGTKIMVLACQAVMMDTNSTGFYINQDDSLLELPSYTRRQINLQLATSEFLELSGHTISSSNILSDFTHEDHGAASAIQAFALRDRRYSTVTNHFRKKYNNSFSPIPNIGSERIGHNIDATWTPEMVKISTGSREILLVSSKHVHQLFFNTGWWELLVAKEVSKWSNIKELMVNCVLPFKSDNSISKNEIDILVNTGKKLIFIECKSGLVKQEDINKMRAIRQTYGGMISKSMLISRFLPSRTIMEKCKELDISTFYCYENNKTNNTVLIHPLTNLPLRLDEINSKLSLY